MSVHGTTPDGTAVVIDHPLRTTRQAVLAVEALRRRRDAAHRLEPLPDGTRDPIDRLTIRSHRMHSSVVWAYVHPDPAEDIAVLRTTNLPELKFFLIDMGWPAVWSRPWRGWLINASDLPDLEAAAQHRGGWVVRRGATRNAYRDVA